MAKQKKRPERWSRSDLELIILYCISVIGPTCYASGVRRLIEKHNEQNREIPAIHGYFRRLRDEGHLESEFGRAGHYVVRFHWLTEKGKAHLQARLRQIRAMVGLTETELVEARVERERKRKTPLRAVV